METLKLALSIDSASTVNSFIYHLRRLPLIRRLFKSGSYSAKDIKFVWIFLSASHRILINLLTALLYYGLVVLGALLARDGFGRNSGESVVQMLMMLALVGGMSANQLIEADYTNYYAINLLKVNAKKYILTRYCLELARKFILGVIYMTVIFLIFKTPPYFILLFPLATAGIKLFFTFFRLRRFRKQRAIGNFPIHGVPAVLYIGVLTAVAVITLFMELILPYDRWGLIGLGIVLVSVPFAIQVFRFGDYLIFFKRDFSQTTEAKQAGSKTAIKAQSNQIDGKTAAKTSSRSGFAYLSDLFLIRHHKLLNDATVIITAIISGVAVLTAVVVGFIIGAEEAGEFMHFLPGITASLPFVFYTINRGAGYSMALYSNCDRTMLHYSFFRKRGNILKLFRIRLLGIARQNLLPALAMGLGLMLVHAVSALRFREVTGSFDPDYVQLIMYLIVSLALSAFFSVHYLTMYYLLQPYDVESKVKSLPYHIVSGVTYIVCYVLFTELRKHIEPMVFSLWAVAFCVIYIAAACLLVLLFAPKTFKNRS